MKKISVILGLAIISLCFSVQTATAFVDLPWDNTLTNEEKLDIRRRVGSPFTKYLVSFYHHMVKYPEVHDLEGNEKFLARKAVIASEGDVVMPEGTKKWEVADKEIRAAEISLHKLLNSGGREFAPETAAAAQAYFDCWVIARHAVKACKDGFMKAMNDVRKHAELLNPDGNVRREYARRQKELEAQRLADLEKKQLSSGLDGLDDGYQKPFIPLEDAMYLVFFDFDKNTLDETGLKVIGASADEIKSRQDIQKIVVIGHTDTSGSDAYNRRLSFKRAESVKKSLAKVGIDDQKIVIRGMGENKLLVKTENNVKEPANRRAEITFE